MSEEVDIFILLREVEEVNVLLREIIKIIRLKETLIYIAKAFNINPSNVQDQISGKINYLCNNHAVNKYALVEIMGISSSVLYCAGNDINQSLALCVGAYEIIQNSRKTGYGLKAISFNLSRENRLLKIQAATGVSGYTDKDNTKLKSTYNYLKDISKVWKNLNDAQQSQAIYNMFGKRNANVGMAILNNWKNVEKAYNDAKYNYRGGNNIK